MKTVKVVAAVICNSLQDRKWIFTTARGYGDFKGQWEFPGGKIVLVKQNCNISVQSFS